MSSPRTFDPVASVPSRLPSTKFPVDWFTCTAVCPSAETTTLPLPGVVPPTFAPLDVPSRMIPVPLPGIAWVPDASRPT